MRIFGFDIRRAPQVRALSSSLLEFLGLKEGDSTPWDFHTAYTKAYSSNPIVYACINEIANAISGIDFVFVKDDEVVEPGEPLHQLFTRPNNLQSFSEFLQQWVAHIYLAGISFIHLPSGAGGRPSASPMMELVNPDNVELVQIGLEHYYKITNRAEPIQSDEMRHIAFPNPRSKLQGFSPVTAAKPIILAFNSAVQWNKSLLDNMGRTSILLTLKNALPGHIDLIKAQEKYERELGGPKNAGKIKVLPGELGDFREFGLNAKDLDWLEGKRDMMREICAVLGVPSQLLGDMANSTYSNYREARKAFYHETVLPLANHFSQEMNAWLLPKYEKSIRLAINTEHVDALRPDLNEKVNRLNTAWWLTVNERRQEVGLEDVEGGDVILVGFNQIPFGSLPENKPEESARGKIRILGVNARQQHGDVLDYVSEHSLYRTEEARLRKYKRYDRTRRIYEGLFERDLRRFWKGQKARVLENIGTWVGASKRDIAGNIFGPEENAHYAEEMHGIYVSMTMEFGQDALDEIGSDILFDVERPDIKEWLAADIAERSRLINDYTGKKIKAVLEEGMAEGEGADKLRARIEELYSSWGANISRGRSIAISRTETGRTVNYAQIEGYKQGGVPLKEWITARDADVRETHQAMDGEVVGINETFSNGGQCPGQTGDPAEDINCRCNTAPLFKESEAV